MPRELVFVRHGYSEGNFATDLSKKGDDSCYTPEFRNLPGSQWRLTGLGRGQAQSTGLWLRRHFPKPFDRFIVSPYLRSQETAALLDLPDAQWREDYRVRERDWGDIGSMPSREFQELYRVNAALKQSDSQYWRPPGGESIVDVRLRVRQLFDSLSKECADQRVIVVVHGELMWAALSELEGICSLDWNASHHDPHRHLHNGHVLHYSQTNPLTGKVELELNYVHSVCPWMGINNSWRNITHQRFTNAELLARVEAARPSAA